MCLAIGHCGQRSNGPFARVWRRVSETPLRLFSLSAAFHLLLIITILVYADANDMPPGSVALFAVLLYGIAAFPVFGALLTGLPKKYALSPVHYARYTGIYLLMFVALLILEAGILLGDALLITGMCLLLPAWLLSLRAISNIHEWLPADRQVFSRIILLLLVAQFAGLGFALLVTLVPGTVTDRHELVLILAPTSLLVWLAVMLLFMRLMNTAPQHVRVVRT
ncbi:MAG TPA: hypothetical protein ENJ11_03885 [Gammaproteobacteria bacterium]|nr:hypothetical protein [Gammaproteobacteria bacterium]